MSSVSPSKKILAIRNAFINFSVKKTLREMNQYSFPAYPDILYEYLNAVELSKTTNELKHVFDFYQALQYYIAMFFGRGKKEYISAVEKMSSSNTILNNDIKVVLDIMNKRKPSVQIEIKPFEDIEEAYLTYKYMEPILHTAQKVIDFISGNRSKRGANIHFRNNIIIKCTNSKITCGSHSFNVETKSPRKYNIDYAVKVAILFAKCNDGSIAIRMKEYPPTKVEYQFEGDMNIVHEWMKTNNVKDVQNIKLLILQ